ncbi:hypothetical protein AAHA92_16588 [Salvia divinorum]|uniref:Uncharacterized protein n=1 Tax=Salvia divinorum TaxID=28513 RepID=A0ABD1GX50_SALDI
MHILAAPAHNSCSSLVCSCYVASRNSDCKEDENGRKEAYNVGGGRRRRRRSRETGFLESSKGVEIELAHPLKSNLKKSASMVEFRKVSWSDAHGKDIAHVQEFEPSEEGELAGVGKSCKCSIQ